MATTAAANAADVADVADVADAAGAAGAADAAGASGASGASGAAGAAGTAGAADASSPEEISVTIRRRPGLTPSRPVGGVFRESLRKDQVEVMTASKVKSRTTQVMLAAAFIDLSGAVLLAGSYAVMCANAPGAVPLGDVPGAFPASDFDAATWLDYAMAINLIAVSGGVGSIFSNFYAGVASDRLGRKLVIQICLLGGVLSYVIMFAAGMWAKNYWVFLSGNFVNGLFSGSRGVISAYLQDIHELVEFQTKVLPIMINYFLFGAMGGSIIGLVWTSVANAVPGAANSAFAVFGPALLGILLSLGSALMIQVYCPEPARKQAVNASSGDGGDASSSKPLPPPPMSRQNRAILAIILVAGSFDSFGDFGNRFARSTILTNRYPVGREPVINYVLLATNIISIFVGQKIVLKTNERLGHTAGNGLWAILGNVASASVQFGLMIIVAVDSGREFVGGYIAVWIVSQVFGVASTFAAAFLWPAYVPAHKRGAYNGFRQSLNSLINVVAPLVLALIYQSGTPRTLASGAALNGSGAARNGSAATGAIASEQLAEQLSKIDDASIACLAVCGSISFLAFVCFLPLPRFLRTPPPAAKANENDPTDPASAAPFKPAAAEAPAKPLEYYDNVALAEWQSLPLRARLRIQQERAKAGLRPVEFPWGTWADDRLHASDFLARATTEFSEIKAVFSGWLTDDTKIAEAVAKRKAHLESKRSEDAKKKAEKARLEIGEWLTAYLDDAGYEGWADSPNLFKSMLMNTFPPLTPLKANKSTWEDASELRTTIIEFLRVLDNHIQTSEANCGVPYEYSYDLPDLPLGVLPRSPKAKRE